jgi:hypothetical protein
MGKIVAALTAIIAFIAGAPLPASAKSSVQDSGGYNNSYQFQEKTGFSACHE